MRPLLLMRSFVVALLHDEQLVIDAGIVGTLLNCHICVVSTQV